MKKVNLKLVQPKDFVVFRNNDVFEVCECVESHLSEYPIKLTVFNGKPLRLFYSLDGRFHILREERVDVVDVLRNGKSIFEKV